MIPNGTFSIDPHMTPEQMAQRRARIAALMPQFGHAQYIGEGLGQLAMGVGMGRAQSRLDANESANQTAANDMFSRIFGARDTGVSTSNSGPLSVLGMRPDAPISQGPIENAPDPNSPEGLGLAAMSATGNVSPYAGAIAGVESAGSGGYQAVGPETGKGRAYGKYQVMDFNIPAWTKKYTGVSMTPEQFLANPGAQEAVFNGEFGAQVAKYGNPQDAAAVWFSGRPLAGNNASDGGNTVPQYVDKFNAGLGGQTAPPQVPMDQLYSALSNPWITPEQKAVITSLISQNTQNADPMHQMEVQKAQLELAQMQQPQEDQTIAALRARAEAAGLQPGSQEYKNFMLMGGTMSNQGRGTSIIWGRDAQGKPVPMQAGPDGTLIASGLPAGVTPLDPANKAYETALGTGMGTNAAAATNLLPQTKQMVDAIDTQLTDLENDPYLANMLGPMDSRTPNVTADAARVQAKMDQLQGGVFLQARQLLKGAGAVTDYEGRKAEEAFGRLNAAQSPEDYKTALEDFRYFVKQGLIKLQDQAAQRPAAPGGQQGSASAPSADGVPTVGPAGEGYNLVPPGGQYRTSDGQIWTKGQ